VYGIPLGKQYEVVLSIRVIDEVMSGDLRDIMLESDFIEASFNDLDWTSIMLDTFIEMAKYGKLRTLSPDLAPDES
jgi:hypothetical protein